MYELVKEPWCVIAEPLLEMFKIHWAEVGDVDSKVPYEADEEQMDALAHAGVLHCWIVHQNKQILGYCLWYVTKSLESKGTLVASQGPWYSAPSIRHTSQGLRLFKHSLAGLKDLGVRQVFPHYWSRGDHGSGLDKFFRKLGARPVETIYSMEL